MSDNSRARRYPVADPLDAMWNDSSGEETGLFGLPFSVNDASLVIVPVPWDIACSQGAGTAAAPELIRAASGHVELHDVVLGNIYERGIAMAAVSPELIAMIEQIDALDTSDKAVIPALDRECEKMNHIVKSCVSAELIAGRTTGLLGGDHSVSFGSIAAHCELFPEMGILQIDAHADLRPSLDGMKWSHASVMHHVMEELSPLSLTQFGVRGICSVERAYQKMNQSIQMVTSHELQQQLASGQAWLGLCDQIIATLPKELYLSLDIDGLDPACCPNTGTPVPGGLSFTQVTLLLQRIVESGRVIRGFDLVEVGGNNRDALIAAHLLYFLCGLAEHRQA